MFIYFLLEKDIEFTRGINEKDLFCKQKNKMFEFDLKEIEIKSALFNEVPEDMFMLMEWV
jgi:hypothetical protein